MGEILTYCYIIYLYILHIFKYIKNCDYDSVCCWYDFFIFTVKKEINC